VRTADPVDLGEISFSPDGAEWFEWGPPSARRRVAFHDYAAIYAVPGLYERVFLETLGMSTAAEVTRRYGEVLAAEGRDPGAERVLDLGAGNGMGGEALRELGVGNVVGLDLEPTAREAARRDRPDAYDDFLVGDVGALGHAERRRLEEHGFTGVLALAAVGLGHVPAASMACALDLLAPGGLFGFAVMPALLPGSDDADGQATGYPDLLAGLLAAGGELARHAYVHRREPDGSPHHAVALIGRV
jgi:predicted TPR repeat methyltransferase